MFFSDFFIGDEAISHPGYATKVGQYSIILGLLVSSQVLGSIKHIIM